MSQLYISFFAEVCHILLHANHRHKHRCIDMHHFDLPSRKMMRLSPVSLFWWHGSCQDRFSLTRSQYSDWMISLEVSQDHMTSNIKCDVAVDFKRPIFHSLLIHLPPSWIFPLNPIVNKLWWMDEHVQVSRVISSDLLSCMSSLRQQIAWRAILNQGHQKTVPHLQQRQQVEMHLV